MPRLEDIEKFGKSLLSLGSEPSVLTRWGEEPEDVEPTDAEVSPELESLLHELPESEESPAEEDFSVEDLDPDLGFEPDQDPDDESFSDDFLQDFAASMEDHEAEEPPAKPQFEAPEEPTAEPQFEPPAEPQFEAPEPAATPEEETVDFDLPSDDDFGDFDTDFGEFDAADTEAAETGAAAEPEAPAGPDASIPDFSFGDDLESQEDAADGFTFDPGEFEIDDEVDEISLEPPPPPVEPSAAQAEEEEPVESEFGEQEFSVLGDEGEAFAEEEEESDELLDVDEFSLGDFGAEFGAVEEEAAAGEEDDLNPAVAISAAPPEAVDASGPEVRLSEEDFSALQRSLVSLPLNVKMAVEEIIAENSAPSADIEKLIKLLVREEAPRTIAAAAGRILGKQLRLPKGYEKQSGREYERLRSSLGYQFREYVWPVLRVVAGAALILALTGFLVYSYVWQPLYARGIYLDGLEHLAEDRYTVANERFAQAETFWRARRWFYTYAEAFIEKRQYGLAVEKYDQLLDHWPADERGILDYARLESRILGNYPKARDLLERLLDRDVYHYAALLASGDNYMEWALGEPERYEDARASYARLIGRYGDTDELLMRMLHYFIRTDNYPEVDHLKNVFQADRRARIDPLIYAELGGYYLNYSEPGDVFDILTRANRRAEELDEPVPEIHYHFARYYRAVENPVEEARALRNSRLFLESAEPLNRRRLGMLVDTYARLGENHYRRSEFIDADELFRTAIRRYEDARARNLLQPEPRFGRVYAGLGNIHYYVERNWEQALESYRLAEANGFRDREMSYRKGFVHYRGERYEEALEQFLNAAEGFTTNRALLFATANALHYSGNYYAAEGYYSELLDEIYRHRARIDTLLFDEDPQHRAVIEYLIRGQNNIGVVYGAIARRESSPEMRRRAMVHLQASQELAVNYRRSPQTGARVEAVNLSFLNLRDILYPLADFDPQIYNAIPQDFSDIDF